MRIKSRIREVTRTSRTPTNKFPSLFIFPSFSNFFFLNIIFSLPFNIIFDHKIVYHIHSFMSLRLTNCLIIKPLRNRYKFMLFRIWWILKHCLIIHSLPTRMIARHSQILQSTYINYNAHSKHQSIIQFWKLWCLLRLTPLPRRKYLLLVHHPQVHLLTILYHTPLYLVPLTSQITQTHSLQLLPVHDLSPIFPPFLLNLHNPSLQKTRYLYILKRTLL